MYLSRLRLDISRRSTMAAMAAPAHFHGAIEEMFHRDRKRRLWRIDCFQGAYYILLLSEDIPNLAFLQEQYGYKNIPGECLGYDKLLERIKIGSVWRFRLVANPTRSVSGNSGSEPRGKISAEVSPKYMLEWLERKGRSSGFEVNLDRTFVTQSRWFSFRKSETGHIVRFKAAAYEGILTVTDPEQFRNMLVSGIGREKAYGMGLLTIASTLEL